MKGKQFVWVWLERLEPKKARVPNPNVIAVRVADDLDKQVLLASDRSVFFTEPHYDGYPAVLVRLSKTLVRPQFGQVSLVSASALASGSSSRVSASTGSAGVGASTGSAGVGAATGSMTATISLGVGSGTAAGGVSSGGGAAGAADRRYGGFDGISLFH